MFGESPEFGRVFFETSKDPAIVANKGIVELIVSDSSLLQDFDERLGAIDLSEVTAEVINQIAAIRDYYFGIISTHEDWQPFVQIAKTKFESGIVKEKACAQSFLDSVVSVTEVKAKTTDNIAKMVKEAKLILAKNPDTEMQEIVSQMASAFLHRIISTRLNQEANPDQKKKLETVLVIRKNRYPMKKLQDDHVYEMKRELECMVLALKEQTKKLSKDQLIALVVTYIEALQARPYAIRLEKERDEKCLWFTLKLFITDVNASSNSKLLPVIAEGIHRHIDSETRKKNGLPEFVRNEALTQLEKLITPFLGTKSKEKRLAYAEKSERQRTTDAHLTLMHRHLTQTHEKAVAASDAQVTRATSGVSASAGRGSVFSVFQVPRPLVRRHDMTASRQEHVRSPGAPQAPLPGEPLPSPAQSVSAPKMRRHSGEDA